MSLLIATDVGSRGLDIPEVAVVVNWEVPRVADDYVHRVGRTARAGRRGTAITFVTEGDVDLVQVLEERISESKGLLPFQIARSNRSNLTSADLRTVVLEQTHN